MTRSGWFSSFVPILIFVSASIALPVSAAAASAGPVTIYLDRHGGVIQGGADDSAAGVSWIAMNGPGGRAKVPAWGGGTRNWNKVVACVRDRFADFKVDIVDQKPTSGDYVRIMVGGRPGIVGQAEPIAGIAPFEGRVMPNAMGFVFAESLKNAPTATCEAIAHEAGHTLGLEHSLACEDLMSYTWCGEKRFRDEPAYCGEMEPRACADGTDTQSSYDVLAKNVGLRAERESERESESESEMELEQESESAGPEIEMNLDRDHIRGNRMITLTVTARAKGGLADVLLGWASEDAQYLVSCAEPDPDLPIQCEYEGDQFRFKIRAGIGPRAIAAVAIDGHGNQAATQPRMIYLEGK